MEHSRNVFCENGDCFPVDSQFLFHNRTGIEDDMNQIPLDSDWEKYRLALFLKTGEYRHPTERLWATEVAAKLEEKHKPKYYGGISPNMAVGYITDLDCPDEHVMINGKCVPCHQVEDSVRGEEVGYYNEDDLVPPITGDGYQVPKDKKKKKRTYSNYTGAK